MNSAVALLAFNRPEYQEQVWQSVKDALCGQDVILFFDGLNDFDRCNFRGGDLEAHKKCVEIGRRIFPEARVFHNSINVGCPVQWGGIYGTVFNALDYDTCLIVEDDLVLSPNYISNVVGLLELLRDEPRAGMVGAFGERPKLYHDEFLGCLTTCGHLWGVATWRDRWEKWRADYHEFCHITIRHGRDNCLEDVAEFYKRLGGDGKASAVNDGALYQIMLKHGSVPVSTVANCAKYIGRQGEYGTPEYFEDRKFDQLPYCPDRLRFQAPDEEFWRVANREIRRVYGFPNT